ncbi:MAG: transposase [Deltaproteobacteria bacterium]|nr:transposase [Deltaproteobacteria bacterium]
MLPSGKVRLKLRKPYYTGQTQLVLKPEAFVRRLFAILPPPRWHLTRYHGIFSVHGEGMREHSAKGVVVVNDEESSARA